LPVLHGTASPARIFRDGIIVALLNPKPAVFFAAFLPQFLSAREQPMVQSIVLGILFVTIAAVTDSGYALAAGTISPVLTRTQGVRKLGRYCSASALLGLGAFSAFAGSRHAK
jgi:threonine/homoserine/homoserine lactone efflux protein